MSLSAVRDQPAALRLLRNVITRNRTPNGLLFWGADGVGKRMTAMEFAKALNCREMELDACDACISCRKAGTGNHPDITVITPTGRSRTVSKETIGEMSEMASFRPVEGRWRVFLLEDAERLTFPAQNHFLKTLEEPPSNSLFILITSFPRALLPTIRSRCQQVRFQTLRPETILELLAERHTLPREEARSIALLSQGQMTRALDLVQTEKRALALELTRRLAAGDDPVLLAEEFAGNLKALRQQVEAQTAELFDTDQGATLTPEEREEMKAARAAVADAAYRRGIVDYLYILQTWYRDQLVYRSLQSPEAVLNRDQTDRLARECSADPGEKIIAIGKARQLLDRYISEDRVFRDLFLSLAAP